MENDGATNLVTKATENANLAVKADSEGRLVDAERYYKEAAQNLIDYCENDQDKRSQMSPHISRYLDRATLIEDARKKNISSLSSSSSLSPSSIESRGVICSFQCANPQCNHPHHSTSISAIDDEFLCGICHELMLSPVSCSEGHTWCKLCIEQWLQNGNSCPVDRRPIVSAALTRNRPLENMISKLDVSCHLKRLGCNWVGHRRLYQEHASSCMFTLKPCSYCSVEIAANQMDAHEEVCSLAILECPSVGCKWTGERRHYLHHSLSCNFRLISCDYCEVGVAVNEIDEHKMVCELAPVSCPYSSQGCEWVGERRHGAAHVASCTHRPALYREDGSLEYEGELVENCKHGKGILFNEYGVVYEGEFEHGRKHGQGVSYHNDGGIEYEGQWLNNFKHGIGKSYNKTGRCDFQGEFKHNRRHGQGMSFNSRGLMDYEGNWEQNHKSGQGISYFSIDSENIKIECDGWWYNNIFMTGEGLSFDDQGRVIYEGQWENGKRHGQGISYHLIVNSMMKSYDGQWKNGQRDGNGISYQNVSYKEVKEYEGQWRNGQRHGQGKAHKEGDERVIYEGHWENGERHGQGISYKDTHGPIEKEYEGQWKNDQRHGQGISFSSYQPQQGRWENDELKEKMK
jgi:antitoxin component YwqK of YwqJK toxin-antitoxin module